MTRRISSSTVSEASTTSTNRSSCNHRCSDHAGNRGSVTTSTQTEEGDVSGEDDIAEPLYETIPPLRTGDATTRFSSSPSSSSSPPPPPVPTSPRPAYTEDLGVYLIQRMISLPTSYDLLRRRRRRRRLTSESSAYLELEEVEERYILPDAVDNLLSHRRLVASSSLPVYSSAYLVPVQYFYHCDEDLPSYHAPPVPEPFVLSSSSSSSWSTSLPPSS